jgi:prophage regulatory protein
MKMLSFPELKERKGIPWSRQHVYRKIDAGEFPRPVHLGEGTAAWPEEEIDRWLTDRIAERDTAA